MAVLTSEDQKFLQKFQRGCDKLVDAIRALHDPNNCSKFDVPYSKKEVEVARRLPWAYKHKITLSIRDAAISLCQLCNNVYFPDAPQPRDAVIKASSSVLSTLLRLSALATTAILPYLQNKRVAQSEFEARCMVRTFAMIYRLSETIFEWLVAYPDVSWTAAAPAEFCSTVRLLVQMKVDWNSQSRGAANEFAVSEFSFLWLLSSCLTTYTGWVRCHWDLQEERAAKLDQDLHKWLPDLVPKLQRMQQLCRPGNNPSISESDQCCLYRQLYVSMTSILGVHHACGDEGLQGFSDEVMSAFSTQTWIAELVLKGFQDHTFSITHPKTQGSIQENMPASAKFWSTICPSTITDMEMQLRAVRLSVQYLPEPKKDGSETEQDGSEAEQDGSGAEQDGPESAGVADGCSQSSQANLGGADRSCKGVQMHMSDAAVKQQLQQVARTGAKVLRFFMEGVSKPTVMMFHSSREHTIIHCITLLDEVSKHPLHRFEGKLTTDVRWLATRVIQYVCSSHKDFDLDWYHYGSLLDYCICSIYSSCAAANATGNGVRAQPARNGVRAQPAFQAGNEGKDLGSRKGASENVGSRKGASSDGSSPSQGSAEEQQKHHFGGKNGVNPKDSHGGVALQFLECGLIPAVEQLVRAIACQGIERPKMHLMTVYWCMHLVQLLNDTQVFCLPDLREKFAPELLALCVSVRKSTDLVLQSLRLNCSPVVSGSIDPVVSGSIDPVVSGSIDPVVSGWIDPVVCGLIDPVVMGLIETALWCMVESVLPWTRQGAAPCASGAAVRCEDAGLSGVWLRLATISLAQTCERWVQAVVPSSLGIIPEDAMQGTRAKHLKAISHLRGVDDAVLFKDAHPYCGCFNSKCTTITGASEAKLNVKKCSRCKAAWYCGVACSKADWRSHKLECRAV